MHKCAVHHFNILLKIICVKKSVNEQMFVFISFFSKHCFSSNVVQQIMFLVSRQCSWCMFFLYCKIIIITTVHLLCLGREVAFCGYHDFLLHSHGSWHVQELPELCQICVLVEIRLWNAYVRHYRLLHHWCNNKQNQWTYLVLICRQLRLYHSPLDR